MQWYELDKERTAEMIEKVKAPEMPSLFGTGSSDARCAKLPFYTNFLLHRLTNYATLPAFSMDFLSDGEVYLYLDGTSSPIYKVNALGDLILNENTILDYLAFFVHYVPGPEGEMLLIDSRKSLPYLGATDIDRHREMLYTHRDVKVSHDEGTNTWTIRVPMYYGGALVKAVIQVDGAGHLNIIDYQMLLKGSFEETELEEKAR